jgi:hypothetical protein
MARQNWVWNDLCLRLWSDKVYVPDKYRMLLAHGKAREALKGSVLDSKRTRITWDEFLVQPFYFRFKQSAGSYFTDIDPFWQRNEALCMKFSQDGPVIGIPDVKWKLNYSGCGGFGSFINVISGDTCLVTYMVTRHRNWGFIIQVAALHLCLVLHDRPLFPDPFNRQAAPAPSLHPIIHTCCGWISCARLPPVPCAP